MLTMIRILRVLVGLVAAWQILGLLPVITSWLPNIREVTGGMWAVALLKALVLVVCSALYVWLGRVKARISGAEQKQSETRIIGWMLLGICAIGIVAGIVIPVISSRSDRPIDAHKVDSNLSVAEPTSGVVEPQVAVSPNKPEVFVNPIAGQPSAPSNCIVAPLGHDMSGYSGTTVSFQFDSVPLRTLLSLIAQESGMQFTADEGVRGNVAACAVSVPWDYALEKIAVTNKLSIIQQGSSFHIQNAPTHQPVQDSAVGVNYKDEHNARCWDAYQRVTAAIPQDAPLAEYARLHEDARSDLDNCVRRG
ncbi:hypothetical protein [Silanimonas sp.]|uniref:hypothetical protein n=1 Tax=Silanimonas sp. TaxID=1929290 RepID=UPI0022CCBC34|nr:hypothetical protein [Silanimonas sp.]MCZ8166729.1 hypothetical protein [Silanimonas sp.]